MEEERDGSLPLTDISFSRDEYRQVMREVYRKPTHTNRYVTFTSHHESVKCEDNDCLVNRAATVSSNDQLGGKSWTRSGKRSTRTVIQSTLWRRPLKNE